MTSGNRLQKQPLIINLASRKSFNQVNYGSDKPEKTGSNPAIPTSETPKNIKFSLPEIHLKQ